MISSSNLVLHNLRDLEAGPGLRLISPERARTHFPETVTDTWLRPEDTESFISSITHIPRKCQERGRSQLFHQGGPEF